MIETTWTWDSFRSGNEQDEEKVVELGKQEIEKSTLF